MDRLIYDKLLEWKDSPNRKPLILKGVRQCGKTYLLRKFGEENYSSTAYFNFERDPTLMSVFEEDLDPKRILVDLGLISHTVITEDTLIIFDEVQFCSAALTSMKYFFEDAPKYHIVCAGSLLGVMLSKPLSFPVGRVNFLTMYPMTFPEFLMANGESKLLEHLRISPADRPINESLMKILNRLYKEYCFVGGMPEAVETWITSHDANKVRKVHRDIIMSYESDFAKHAPPKDIPKLNSIWSSIPEQLSKENKKFLFGHAVSGARAKDLEDALQWLIDAGLVIKVSLLSRPSIPLSAYSDPSHFKLYYSDIGLLGTMAGLPASSLLSNDIRYKEFKGGMTENYVLIEMIASIEGLPFYWRSGNRAEVDFVHMINGSIVPIEVKSGPTSRIQSLERYIAEYDPEKAFVVSNTPLRLGKVTFIPHPLVWNIGHYA